MSESHVVFEVLDAWGAHQGLRVWRNNTGAAMIKGRLVSFGLKGQADISGIIAGGRRLEIECKTRTGKQREAQIIFQGMIERYGGLYVLARSVEDVDRALAAEGLRR